LKHQHLQHQHQQQNPMLAKTTVIAVTAIITPPMPWDFGSTVPICIDHPYEAANCGA
jgi:hypothetical protein